MLNEIELIKPGDISNINGTINMSREIIEMLGSQLNDLSWDVKDLSR